MFFTFREILDQFLSSDVFIWMEFWQDFFFHRTNPWFRFEAKQHWNVFLGRVTHSIVQQPSTYNIRIELQILPIFESEILDSVQQFLLLLDQYMLIKGIKDIFVYFERFIQNKILNPAILNNLFLSTCDSVLIHLENQFSIIGLCKESYTDHVTSLKFMDDSINGFFWERKPLMENFSGFWTFRPQELENFDTKCFVRVSNWNCFPFGRCCSIEFTGNFKRHIFCVVIAKINNRCWISFG